MKKKFEILRVKDKTDSYYVEVPGLPNINFKIGIVGASQRSGKTTIILNFLLRKRFYKKYFHGDDIFLITNNKLDNKLKILREEKEIPGSNVMEYDEDMLEVLYDSLEEDFEAAIDLNEKPTPKILIFDDVAYSGSLKDKTAGIVSKIAMNGRHAMISSIFTTQKFSLLSTGLRTNLSAAVLFNTNNKELDLIEQDFNYLKTRKAFVNMFKDITGDGKNAFLVVDLNEPVYDGRYKDKNFNNIDVKKYES